jgi:hypothetical protein
MRTATLVLAAAVVTATAASPAMATTKKKPITKTYTATAPAPDPTNAAGGYTVCAQTVPQSFDKQAFNAPAAGKLAVEVDGIIGDWDLLITDAAGNEVSSSGSGGYGTPVAPSTESVKVKIKRKGSYNIIACNWAGAPTATVKYVFTYA